jgi:hypothetical protein
MTTIEIYPKSKKPSWLKIGIKCHCLGEASDVFIVHAIDNKSCSVELIDKDGYYHGRESWSKLTVLNPAWTK